MMTTVGRGRGNWVSKDFSTPLRRPGEASRSGCSEDDLLMKEIASLEIGDDKKLQSLEEQIKKYCDNREHLWKICQKMYESGAKDKKMIGRVVRLWNNLRNFEVNEVKLRSVLMNTAQKDYEEREEVREEDHDRFLNAIALFGGIFHNMTPPGGGIYNVLVDPMIEYLKLLLTECSEDISIKEAELEMLAMQINLNGPALKEHAKDHLEEFELIVRSTIVTSLPSKKCHYWLLLILDLAAFGCPSHRLPEYMKSFYLEKLGNAFEKIMTDVPSSGNHLPNVVDKTKNSEEIPSRPKRTGVSFDRNTHPKESSYSKSNQRTWLDGSGDHQERKKPPYWEHDDRFDGHSDSNSSESPGYNERGGCRNQGRQGNGRDRGDARQWGSNRGAYGGRMNDNSFRRNQPKEALSSPPEESWD